MRIVATLVLSLVVVACTGSVAQPTSVPGATTATAAVSASIGPDTLNPLTDPTNLTPGADSTLSSVADAPPGYSGNSVQVTISNLGAGANSENQLNGTWDFSGYTDAAMVKVWVKASTLTNLRTTYVIFKSSGGFAAYGYLPKQAGAWEELSLAKGFPSSGTGIDWAHVLAIDIRGDASAAGPYTGQLSFRDLRLIH